MVEYKYTIEKSPRLLCVECGAEGNPWDPHTFALSTTYFYRQKNISIMNVLMPFK